MDPEQLEVTVTFDANNPTAAGVTLSGHGVSSAPGPNGNTAYTVSVQFDVVTTISLSVVTEHQSGDKVAVLNAVGLPEGPLWLSSVPVPPLGSSPAWNLIATGAPIKNANGDPIKDGTHFTLFLVYDGATIPVDPTIVNVDGTGGMMDYGARRSVVTAQRGQLLAAV